jgi:hypothetical protein
MVLQFLKNTHGPGIEVLSRTRIASICNTTEGGTDYAANERLNKHTIRFTPSVEFELKSNQDKDGLIEEIGKYLPVIALLEMPHEEEEDVKYPHAIVITGIDISGREIIYNDPLRGKDKRMEIGLFRSHWAKDYCVWYIRLDWQKKLNGGTE